MDQLILSKSHPPLGILTLNRPKFQNSLIPEMLENLLTGLHEFDHDQSIRVIVLNASGSVFSTGDDLREYKNQMRAIESYSENLVGLVMKNYSEYLVKLLNQVILTMLRTSKPIVTSVHGIVAGGSMGLVLASDITLVTPQASFTPYYSDVGLAPDGGWTALAPQIIGAGRAAEVLMTNKTITADQALDWGIAGSLAQTDEITEKTRQVAKTIAAKKPGSLRLTKKLLNQDVESISLLLESELAGFVEQIQTREAQQGILGFLDRSR